jgi:hypothetical protein
MANTSPSLRLTSRDVDILEALGSYRFLSVPQLAVLYFASRSTAEARLRALHTADLVVRVFMPVRPFDRTATTIYALGPKGSALVGERREGVRPRHLTAKDRRSALFLDHTLRRNDVRICLELLDRDLAGFHLLTWKQAPEEVRGSAVVRSGTKDERIPVVPDGFFAVRYRGEITAYCLETDMGTVNTERMLARYRAYLEWWRTGGMAARFGRVPTRVLTMTTAPGRRPSGQRGLLVHLPDPGRHRESQGTP